MIAKESSISNKDKIILISLFYFMIFQNVLENYFNIFGILDEAMSAAIVIIAIINILSSRRKYVICKKDISLPHLFNKIDKYLLLEHNEPESYGQSVQGSNLLRISYQVPPD